MWVASGVGAIAVTASQGTTRPIHPLMEEWLVEGECGQEAVHARPSPLGRRPWSKQMARTAGPR